MAALYGICIIFAFGLRQLFPRHFEIKRSVMLILVSENVGNFQPSKDSIVVLTHIAWAAIVTSASMVSYDLQVRVWLAVPRFSYKLKFYKHI